MQASGSTDARHLEDVARRVIARAMADYDGRFRAFSSSLRALTAGGVRGSDFAIYRSNYFYRTSRTLAMIARVLFTISSQPNMDRESFVLVRRILEEESGEGGQPMHIDMLFESHNVHGSRIFALAPLGPAAVDGALDIIDEARIFRVVQTKLYSSTAYACVIGAFLAQEQAAEPMLELFYSVFFEPLEHLYPPSGFEVVKRYFMNHLKGVEKEHAERALHCALRACAELADVDELERGMIGLLSAQADLWDAMLLKMKTMREGDRMRSGQKQLIDYGA